MVGFEVDVHGELDLLGLGLIADREAQGVAEEVEEVEEEGMEEGEFEEL